MSYAQYGTIQASDYNALVGANPGGTANVLNTVWATGSGGSGYGQTAEANVAVGDTVTAVKWANLITKTSNSASHQSSSITSVTAPASGNTITYNANVVTNLQTIYTNRLNAVSQSATSSNTATYGSTWLNAITFTHTVSFANGDAARYFFNSGGQLAITCAHPAGTGINLLLNNLASNVGTVVLSSPITGAATIYCADTFTAPRSFYYDKIYMTGGMQGVTISANTQIVLKIQNLTGVAYTQEPSRGDNIEWAIRRVG